MPLPLHAGCLSAPTHDCRILRASVGLDYCLASCRLVERKNGVCLAFAAAYSSVTAEELCGITSEVSLTPAAENALIHVNAPTSSPVNPPAELEDRIMDSEIAAPVASVEDAKKSRTAAATAARLAKIKARKEAEMAARVAAGLPAVEVRVKKKPGPKPGWKKTMMVVSNPTSPSPSIVETAPAGVGYGGPLHGSAPAVPLGAPSPDVGPLGGTTRPPVVDTQQFVGPGLAPAQAHSGNVMPILIFVETAPNSATYRPENVDMVTFLEIVKSGRKVITATEYRMW